MTYLYMIVTGRWQIHILITLVILLLQTTYVHGEIAGSHPPELQNLIAEGLQQNRQLQSLEAEVQQLKNEIGFAGALDDPRIGLGVLNLPTDSFSFDQEPMTQKQILLAQKLPWFGKLDLKSKRAATLAIRQNALLSITRHETVRQIATSYYELIFVRSSLDTNSKLSELVDGLLRVAETRYATGKGLQQDVLQAQVEMSKLLDERIVLKKKERSLEDRLNGFLSRERFAAINTGPSPSTPEVRLELEKLKQLSLAQNPLLAVKRAEIDQAILEIELARKDYWPDVDLRFAYGQRDTDLTGRNLPDLVSGQVVFNIPLWKNKRQDNRLAAARAKHTVAVKAYQNVQKSLPFRVDELASAIHDTQDNYRLYKEAIVLQAGSWAESALVSYEVGKLEFNTMISAQLRQLRFELQARRYQTIILQQLAELDEILGSVPETLEPQKEQVHQTDQRAVTGNDSVGTATRQQHRKYWGVN